MIYSDIIEPRWNDFGRLVVQATVKLADDEQTRSVLFTPNHPDPERASIYDRLLASEFGVIAPPEGEDEELDRRINEYAKIMQQQAVGTADPDRQKLFEKNLQAAQAVVSSAASQAQIDSLQRQLNANIAIDHPIIKSMSLTEFANWIASYADLMEQSVGLIEDFYIRARALMAQRSIDRSDALEVLERQFSNELNTVLGN